ncbi:MAG: putative bifunctional diguanylate cyclase/phosphodiesterase [Solirubrobacterales bacterium]
MWRGATTEQVELLDWVFGAAPSGMAIVEYDSNVGGSIVFANPALEVLTGYSREELQGMPAYRLIPKVSDQAANWRNELIEGIRSNWSDDVELFTKDGEIRQVHLTISSILEADDSLVAVAHAVDVTDYREASSRLEFLAGHDALTGLPGAQRMEAELRNFSRQGPVNPEPRALAVIDIDGFTFLNDRLGFDGGDQILRAIAGLMERATAEEGLAVRVGGNRFALFWPKVNAGEVAIRITALLQQIRSSGFLAGLGDFVHGLNVTASAGIAIVSPANSAIPSKVLAAADQALGKAKRGGRDCLVTIDMQSAPAALAGLSEIRELVARGVNDESTFRFDGQPIIDFSDGSVVGHELLLRATLADGTVVMPDQIIPLAEETGLIRKLDRWVVRHGIELAAGGGVGGNGGSIWMNMSAQSLADGQLAEMIENELVRTGADPSRLVFEMTERQGHADFRGVGRLVSRLREAGCSCALDDFGAGYGGFRHLKEIPFDLIKIDGTFVERLAQNEIDQAVVHSIVTAVQVAGRKTVAEFVSDEPGFDLLREWGVDFAQGFYLDEPVPVEL